MNLKLFYGITYKNNSNIVVRATISDGLPYAHPHPTKKIKTNFVVVLSMKIVQFPNQIFIFLVV